MNNFINKTKMWNGVFGAYNPTSLRIKVYKTISDAPQDDVDLGFLNDFDCATLFHEFIHHLQNTSSIVGLQHLDLLVSMWHNIRNVVNSVSDVDSLDRSLMSLKRMQQYTNNNENTSKILGDVIVSSIEKVANCHGKTKSEITNLFLLDLNPAKIKCKNKDDDLCFNVSFGIFEFYESCANTMEEFFCDAVSVPKKPAAFIPYEIGDAIAKHLYPNCTTESMIVIMLTSLQHAAPHNMFIFLMFVLGIKNGNDKEISSECEGYVLSLLDQNKKWLIDTQKSIDAGFPEDDPALGNVIKSITKSIIDNIEIRERKPFFELLFLKSLNVDNFRSELKKLIVEFGGCGIYIEDQTKVQGENVTLEVVDNNNSFYNFEKGWLTFQASMHYTGCHFEEGRAGIMEPKLNFTCPLTTYCKHPYNKKNESDFRCSPSILPAATENADNCPYQLAIHKANIDNLHK